MLTMIGRDAIIWPVTSKTITQTETEWVTAPDSAAAPVALTMECK